MKKRTGCADCLSDKESDGTHQKFPAPSLTNVLALGPGVRVHLGHGLWMVQVPPNGRQRLTGLPAGDTVSASTH